MTKKVINSGSIFLVMVRFQLFFQLYSQIRKFNLKTGDIVRGNKRIKSQGEKFSALL